MPDTSGAGPLIRDVSRNPRIMQTTPPVQQTSVGLNAAAFAPTGLALVLASVFAFLACSGGLLFSGVTTFSSVLVTVVVCAIVTPLTALVCRRKNIYFRWRTLVIEVSSLALVAVAMLSWQETRHELQMFMNPAPVPNGLRVHHGRKVMFGSFVHFTAPPAAIARLIQLKELVEVPDDPDQLRASSRLPRLQSKAPWDWWQPATMSNPRFFYRQHDSLAVQGWDEGWWVNDATNEVYAFIGG